MASFKSVASAALVFASAATAHFNLMVPTPIGFNEDKEDTAPCGGFTPDFSDASKVIDFHVGGEPVGVKLGHTQAQWLFRGTLDQTGSSNWTMLFPIVMQSGLGLFCEPSIPAPESWVGKQGVLGVVADAPDGLLYQVRVPPRGREHKHPSQRPRLTIRSSTVRGCQFRVRYGDRRVNLYERHC